jgi:WD40 repeat protein
VRLWDLAARREALVPETDAADGAVTALCFSRDGGRLAGGTQGHLIRVWDAATGRLLSVLRGHGAGVTAVCFSPDGRRLASAAGKAGAVRLWDAETGQELLDLGGHTAAISSLCFSADGQRLLAASVDGAVRVWDATPLPDRAEE